MSRPRDPQALTPWAASAAVLCSLAAARAAAHPSPAVPPEFPETDCITIVDTRETTVMPVQYHVSIDDTMPEPDHITLADSKTHQFFAFRGQVLLNLPDYTFLPFDPALPTLNMPQWISADDLSRSSAANTPEMAPDFSADAIGGDTLTDRADLAGQWLTIADGRRVPITEAQSQIGVGWTMKNIPAGVYGIAGYIFSPPYNGWEPRPGVIKVIDGQRDVPALTVDPVDASLFNGQGRKIVGCVDAPAGTMLHASYRIAGDATAPWQEWTTQASDDSGRYELCFRSPDRSLAGLVQIRVSARAPNGDETAAYAPDQLALVASDGPCSANEKFCCDAAATDPLASNTAGAPASTAGNIATAQAGASAAAQAGAAAATPPLAAAASAGAGGAAAGPVVPPAAAAGDSGCTVAARGHGPNSQPMARGIVLLVLTLLGRRWCTRRGARARAQTR